MKKTKLFICVLLITSFIIALPSCDMKNNKDTLDDYSISEEVIYDENGIKITALGAVYDEHGNPGLKLRTESSTPTPAMLSINGDAVNGVYISNVFSSNTQTVGYAAEISQGDSTECNITFDKQNLTEIGIKSIKSFDLYIMIGFEGEYTETPSDMGNMFTQQYHTKSVTVKTSLFDDAKQELNLNGAAIYDGNGIRLTVNKSDNKNILGINDIYFALENISNENLVCAQITDFETYNSEGELVHLITNNPVLEDYGMNGIEPTEILTNNNGIASGRVVVTSALLLEDTLITSGLMNIDKLRFNLTLTFNDPDIQADQTLGGIDLNSVTIPYGEFNQTVEVDFSTNHTKLLYEYDPSNIAKGEYVIDNGDGNIGEIIIFDEQGLKITVLSMTDDKEGIELRIENNSKEAFGIYFADTVVNGIEINNESIIYGLYGSYLSSLYGLCNLSNVQPGDKLETQYSPALIEARGNINSGDSTIGNGTQITVITKDTVTGELQNLSFRLVIANAASDVYSITVRTAKIINITVD